VGNFNDLYPVETEPEGLCQRFDLRSRSNQDRHDQAGFRRLECGSQRCLIAWMSDRSRQRLARLRRRNQPLVFLVLARTPDR
jgi:hypothetical protein